MLFQTYGDVTFDNILKSVSSMAGNDHLTMTLCCREVTDKMQRTLQRYQDRQWITTLHVLTDDLMGEAIVIEGDFGTVVIQGPIQDTAAQRGTPVLYAGQFCPIRPQTSDIRHPLAKLLDARLRRQSSLADSADDADTQGIVPAAAKGEADSIEGLSPKSAKKKSRTPKPKKQ